MDPRIRRALRGAEVSVARRAFVLAVTVGLAQIAAAADVLVHDPREFDAAVAVAGPDDAIVLADGTWRDASLLFTGEGRQGQPITLRAQTPGKVVLTGESRLQIAGGYLVVDGLVFRGPCGEDDLVAFRRSSKQLAHDCRLTNCAFVDASPAEKKRETKWISLYGARHRVDHCSLRGKTNVGTTLVVWVGDEPNEHRIDHNYFGPRPELKKNGGETIRVGTSDVSMNASRTVVESNCFEECNGEIEIVSNKSCENVYQHNTFLRCAGALTLRHGNRCLVAGNFFLGEHAKRTGGVRIIGEDHRAVNNYFAALEGDDGRAALSMMAGVPDSPLNGYFQVQRAVVAFNTLVDCKHNLVVGLCDKDADNRLPPIDCTFANNLVVGRGQGVLVEQPTPPLRARWQGNLLLGGELPGTMPDIRSSDPQLTLAVDGLWRPSAASPVRRGAVGTFAFITDDIDGQPRGASKDIGCDQSSSAPVLHHPLAPADVGPAWLNTTPSVRSR
jgi:poly(beta-D-mannuronate) lyase